MLLRADFSELIDIIPRGRSSPGSHGFSNDWIEKADTITNMRHQSGFLAYLLHFGVAYDRRHKPFLDSMTFILAKRIGELVFYLGSIDYIKTAFLLFIFMLFYILGIYTTGFIGWRFLFAEGL